MDFKLVPETDPVLKRVAEEWDYDNPPMDATVLVEGMFRLMKTSDGVGIAAPQIGVSAKVFVVEIGGIKEEYFNPEIVRFGTDLEKIEEGCLSFPGLLLPVERPTSVTIRFQNRHGTMVEQDYSGRWARCVQHETDHCNGVTMANKVSRLVLGMAKKKRAKRN